MYLLSCMTTMQTEHSFIHSIWNGILWFYKLNEWPVSAHYQTTASPALCRWLLEKHNTMHYKLNGSDLYCMQWSSIPLGFSHHKLHANKRYSVKNMTPNQNNITSKVFRALLFYRDRAACQKAVSPPFGHSNSQSRAGNSCNPDGLLAQTWPGDPQPLWHWQCRWVNPVFPFQRDTPHYEKEDEKDEDVLSWAHHMRQNRYKKHRGKRK